MKPHDHDLTPHGILSESRMYQEYATAFNRGTGLPLRLQELETMKVMSYPKNQENPFCALMAKTNQSCAACYRLQQKIEEQAQMEPKTLKCFAGLCDTSVPVRVAGKTIAFLQTGQILLHQPNKAEFNRTAQMLVEWGSQVDLKRLEEAYFATRVLTPKQYESLIRLLEIFAQHLASCANALSLEKADDKEPAIAKARDFIKGHSEEELSLSAVARVVNMSASYFSEKFKEVTGLNFVDYVARTRIEKARSLLENPNRRISEVAFEVGFQSLSQFNRTFKRVTGRAPSEYRAEHM